MSDTFTIESILDNIEQFTKTAEADVQDALDEALKGGENKDSEKTAEENKDSEKTAEENKDSEKTAEENQSIITEEELNKIAELEAQGQLMARAFVSELSKLANEAPTVNMEKNASDETLEASNRIINNIVNNIYK